MRILRLWLTGVRVNAGWLASLFGFIILMVVDGSVGRAQNVCQNPGVAAKGEFKLDKPQVCVGSPINIVAVPANVQSVKYNYQYDGTAITPGTTLLDATTFTYSKPGSYTVLQLGSNGSGSVYCQVVDVLPIDPVVFTAQACIGRRVTLKIDPSTLGKYDGYVIRWGDGFPEEKNRAEMLDSPSHTYNIGSTNTPTVTVEGRYVTANTVTCSSTPSTKTVPLLSAATQPFISELTTTSDNTIDIKYQTDAGISVKLFQKKNGVYSDIGQQGTGLGTFTVQTDARQVQCFQLVAQDACNSTAALKSDEICSLILDVKAANKQNNVSWQRYAGTLSATTQFKYYRIRRNNAPTGGTINNVDIQSLSDNDTFECGMQYCYVVEATIAGSGQTIVTSAPVCVNGVNGDPPGDVGAIIVSVEDGHPRLVTTPPTAIGLTDSFTMIVSRASGPSGSFQPVASLDRKSTYSDESADPSAGSYCYQVTYQNGCGLQSNPSATVCSVFLQAKTDKGIDWNADSPFTPETVASYTLEVIDDSNGAKQEITVGSNTHYDPDPNDPSLQSQKYRIIAVSDGGLVSYSNYYTFRREARILIPDAFTPNGDGMNDTFIVKGIYLDQFTMNIYSRWGEVVYSTTDKGQGWDGTISGQNASPGQYMYRIDVTDLTGQKTVRTGALLLVR